MAANGGPGPSTMANTSSSSSQASFVRQKKRVVNLVNPADPIEMLNTSDSLEVSTERPVLQTFIREATPPDEEMLPKFTPRGIDENGVRGILRSSGTPGSGNGVRFFPKNRFRVITPNGTVAQPVTPATPATPAPSFLSSLIAVATMSPRRSPAPAPETSPRKTVLEDSWEQPGEEGELSLIGSSVHSDAGELQDGKGGDGANSREQEEEQEPSWSGVPEQICSPLALPAENDSREVSYQELDLPSASMQIPEDMSNLLSVQMSPPPGGSFSLFDSSSRNISRDPVDQRPGQQPLLDNSWTEQSQVTLSVNNVTDDDSPTIRRRLSPVSSPVQQAATPPHEPRSPAYSPPARLTSQAPPTAPTLETPVPASLKPAQASIFADLSAEQALLSWPLPDVPAVEASKAEQDESAFHSVRSFSIDNRPSANVEAPYSPMLPPRSPFTRGISTTPKTTPGDMTEFFDAASSIISSSPCPTRPSLALIAGRSASVPPAVSGPVDLVRPAKELFDAQSAQTTALRAELDLYRSLTRKLHNEVSEREGALADLQLRALEADMLRSQLSDVQRELQRARERSRSSSASSSSMSPSPLAARSMRAESLAADRTTVVQAETRDLEIRLAKALSDQQIMAKQLNEVKMARDEVVGQLSAARNTMKEMEDRQRDKEVAEQVKHREEERSSEINGEQLERMERLQEEIRDLREIQIGYEEEIEQLREQIDSRQEDADPDEIAYLREKNEELETKVRDLEAAEQEHEQDIARLQAEAESARTASEQEEELQSRVYELEAELQSLQEVRRGDEEEIARLNDMLEKSKGLRRSQDDMRMQVVRLEEDLERQRRDLRDLAAQAKEERERREEAESANAELKTRLQQTRAQLSDLASSHGDSAAIAPLRAELAKLRSESASKDLEIASLQRRKAELKDDREMLNIALDSKQQELELLKRKYGVRGVAGSTPLGTSARPNITADTPAPYSTHQTDTPAPQKLLNGSTAGSTIGSRRRTSAAYVTPLVGHGRTLRSASGSSALGKPFAASTAKPQRLLRRIEDDHDENVLPQRADRLLA